MALYIVAFQEGFLYGILALGIYLSLRILNLPDLTTEGSFGFGASIAAMAASAGHPVLSLPLALLAARWPEWQPGFCRQSSKSIPFCRASSP